MSVLSTTQRMGNGSLGIGSSTSGLLRQAPEPRSSSGSWGRAISSTIQGVGSTLLGGASALGSTGLGVGGDFSALLAQQIEVQTVMQQVSMISNIEKSKHEIEMTPIRNMRVG